MKRGKLPLDFVLEREIQVGRFVGFAMAQDGFCFTRIVIAVVAEENNFAANFFLQPPRCLDFGKQKSFWEKPAGLLAETK